MKYLNYVIILFILLTPLLYAYEFIVYNDSDYESLTSTTIYTEEVKIDDDIRGVGQFNGLLGYCIYVDSLTDTTTNDSFCTFPMYKINGVWHTGDTMSWAKIGKDTVAATTQKWIVPDATPQASFLWIASPLIAIDSSLEYLRQYPYDESKLKITHNDSVKMHLRISANIY